MQVIFQMVFKSLQQTKNLFASAVYTEPENRNNHLINLNVISKCTFPQCEQVQLHGSYISHILFDDTDHLWDCTFPLAVKLQWGF